MDIKVIPICRIIQRRAGRAFDAHSKDKDSFYSKKCKKDELNELWEREIKKTPISRKG